MQPDQRKPHYLAFLRAVCSVRGTAVLQVLSLRMLTDADVC
jgi:hypothetical protein